MPYFTAALSNIILKRHAKTKACVGSTMAKRDVTDARINASSQSHCCCFLVTPPLSRWERCFRLLSAEKYCLKAFPNASGTVAPPAQEAEHTHASNVTDALIVRCLFGVSW